MSLDAVILANQQSKVEESELKNTPKDLTYSTAPPYPIFGKQNKKYGPRLFFTGAPDGESHTYDVAPGYFNHFARIKNTFRINATNTNNRGCYQLIPFGVLLLREMKVIINGVQIASIKGPAYRALVYKLPDYKRDYILRYSRALKAGDVAGALTGLNENEPPVAGAELVHSYTHILTSWYSGALEKAINTSKVKTMQIEVTFNTMSEMGLPANAISSLTGEIDMRYWKPEDKVYRSIMDKDYSNPLSMECFDTFVESVPLSASGTIEFPSQCTFFVKFTYIFAARSKNTTATCVGSPFQTINYVSLEVGGSPYMNQYTRSELELEGLMNGMRSCGIIRSNQNYATTNFTGPMAVCDSGTEIYPIDWSAIGSENSNSGGAFFSKLNNPKFTVNWTHNAVGADTAGEYTMYFVHYYLRNNVIDGEYINTFA